MRRPFVIVLAMLMLATVYPSVSRTAVVAEQATGAPARAMRNGDAIVLDNGIVRITLSATKGTASAIEVMRGGKWVVIGSGGTTRPAFYFDYNVVPRDIPPEKVAEQPKAGFGAPVVTGVHIVSEGPDRAEVAFESAPTFWRPFASEHRLILPRGESGFYADAVYRHGEGMKAAELSQTRFVLRGISDRTIFTHHIIDESRKGPFPTLPPVETLQDSTERLADGTVFTKYDNAAFTKDFLAHGLAGNGVPGDPTGGIGLWVLWPSHEFLNGGPLRQDLTVHPENVLQAMFQSQHFGAPAIEVASDEKWSRFYGPVFYYVNQGRKTDSLFEDAKSRAMVERAKWPYAWVNDADYPLKRSTVTGSVVRADGVAVEGAWAILAPPGEIDWAQSARGYMFWSKVNAAGRFAIGNVRPGMYDLFVSGANEFIDFKKEGVVVDGETPTLDVGQLEWQPTRHGRMLWQIGRADRGTDEFMDGEDPRNYERFLHYFKAFPDDVTFTVGRSKEKRDWYYAQWSWFNKRPEWTICFDAEKAGRGTATLTLGIAGSQPAGSLVVRINGKQVGSHMLARSGAAAYRSGSQDSKYRVIIDQFDGAMLKAGRNEVTLSMTGAIPFPSPDKLKELKRPRGAIMYDSIRLEVDESKPPPSSDK